MSLESFQNQTKPELGSQTESESQMTCDYRAAEKVFWEEYRQTQSQIPGTREWQMAKDGAPAGAYEYMYRPHTYYSGPVPKSWYEERGLPYPDPSVICHLPKISIEDSGKQPEKRT
jgi:hypothetical protein